jgi:AcrR family transcriptional regulator
MLWAMARWEPDARQRLVAAALDLFTEQGYDDTTVAQIADRAGLTKSTFFRHFPDKREVLVAGQDTLSRLFAEGIDTAPDGATPLEAVAAGLDALTATFTDDRRAFAARLRAVIAANGELRERAVFKRAGLASAAAEALEKRGLPEPTATLAAELGVGAFYRAFDRWADPAAQQTLTELTREALGQLRAATATLG